jgi:AcrR family transcriptional regulator
MSPPRRTADATEQLRRTLLDHARTIIDRDGASALTMRSLATEAGCAVGLPYKVFTDRGELVLELVRAELARLAAAGGELVERSGRHAVGDNLAWFARIILDSPAVALASEIMADTALADAFAAKVHDSADGPAGFAAAFARYLAAEQQAGRVAPDVDPEAYGFLLAGAIHNLVVSGPAYPRPDSRVLERHLAAIADQLRR